MNITLIKKGPARVFILMSILLGILLSGLVITKNAYAGSRFNTCNKAPASSESDTCGCAYATNPIVYALYLKARNAPISKNDIKTYIKIVNPAKYKHDRYNPFLWSKLFSKDKLKLDKLMDYVNSVKCFSDYINADLSGYSMAKGGFYLTYSNTKVNIQDGMKTHRNINFIKSINGRIYYLFHNLTIVHTNAGDFNFLSVPEKKAEKFINGRTGTFGSIKRSVYLEYSFVPLTAKHNVLKVMVLCVRVYSDKHENLLLGTIR